MISVIVPVYKVEAYIHRCVDSILKQTYTNYESWLVDDGSPDNCGSICDDYALCDDRFIVIHKQNGGLSDARNAALDLSEGQYITFIDSDDWVAEDALETMFEALLRTNADMAIGNMFSETEDGRIAGMDGNVDEETVLNGKEIWSTILQPCAPKKLYKSYIWDQLRFPVGRLYEDAFTYHHVLDQIKRIVKTGKPTYYYLVRQGSIMHTAYTSRNMDIIDAIAERIEFLKRADTESFLCETMLFLYSQISAAYAFLDKNDNSGIERRKQCKTIYDRYYPDLMKSVGNSKQKIRLWVLRYFPEMHTLIWGRKMSVNLG